MLRDEWTLVGAPTVDEGIELDGATQYATVPLNGELNNAEMTIDIEFEPDFAHDDGVSHRLVDTNGGGGRTLVFKSAGGGLQVYCGNTTQVLVAAAGVYGAYWVQGGRNLLTAICDASGVARL